MKKLEQLRKNCETIFKNLTLVVSVHFYHLLKNAQYNLYKNLKKVCVQP